MISGRFGDTTGSPYVEGLLYLPRFRKKANLSLLVDTGADRTMLMPGDGVSALALDFDKLAASVSEDIGGIGGSTEAFLERAVIAFAEPEVALHYYELEILVLPMHVDLLGTPSLLGRDILNNWEMRYAPNRKRSRLTFRVVTSGLSIPL